MLMEMLAVLHWLRLHVCVHVCWRCGQALVTVSLAEVYSIKPPQVPELLRRIKSSFQPWPLPFLCAWAEGEQGAGAATRVVLSGSGNFSKSRRCCGWSQAGNQGHWQLPCSRA